MSPTRKIGLPLLLAILAIVCSIASCSKDADPVPATPDASPQREAFPAKELRRTIQRRAEANLQGDTPFVMRSWLPDSSVPDIDRQLATYREVRIVVIANVDGEVFPCGCSDGQIGGLIGLIPKLDAQRAALVVSAGDNYVPRSFPKDALDQSRGYFAQRARFVRQSIAQGNELVEVMSMAEAAGIDAEVLPHTAVQPIKVNGQGIDLIVARAEDWSNAAAVLRTEAASEVTKGSRLSLLLVAGDHLNRDATVNGIDQGLWFRSPMDPRALPRNLFLVAGPERGGRAFVTISILVPAAPSMDSKFVFLDELLTLRTAILRAEQQGAGTADFRSRLERRATALLEEQPVFLHVRHVPIRDDDPIDSALYRRYSEFLANHSSAATNQLIAAGSGNARCAPCHADYVKHFEASDSHFHAMDVLRKAGKSGDPFCASCHITPITMSSQSATAQKTQFVEGVQCQWCHQNADQHARYPNKVKPIAPTSRLCVTCHNENQSAAYDWDTYLRGLSCYQLKRKEGQYENE